MIVGLILGVVLNTPVQQAWRWATWNVTATNRGVGPTCSDPGWYNEVRPEIAQAYHVSATKYSAQYTMDNDPDTAWVGPLEQSNNWIEWNFSSLTTMKLICVRNGYASNYVTYAGNLRVRSGSVSGCSSSNYPLNFLDHVDLAKRQLDSSWNSWNGFNVNCETKGLQLNINTVYPAYDGSNLIAISDVKFYEGWRWN